MFKNAVIITILLVLAVSCGKKEPLKEIEDPLPTPAYGDEESNVDLWLETMEVGSRELYAARGEVLAACKISAGDKVADIGAGTGLYTVLFGNAVGKNGVVYAIDIEPRFLRLINQKSADNDLENVVAVLGQENDITLPENSVDFVYIADTYHYFSDRAAIMKTVFEALNTGGRLAILDYNVGSDPDPTRAHVLFGAQNMINEIESFGFKLVERPEVSGLVDIYMLVFEVQKP